MKQTFKTNPQKKKEKKAGVKRALEIIHIASLLIPLHRVSDPVDNGNCLSNYFVLCVYGNGHEKNGVSFVYTF